MSNVRTQRGTRSKDDHRHYEVSDIDPKWAGWTIGDSAEIVAIVCLCVAGLFLWLGTLHEPAPPPPAASAAPALQIDERADRAVIDVRARTRLEGKRGGEKLDAAMRQTAAAGWDAPQ